MERRKTWRIGSWRHDDPVVRAAAEWRETFDAIDTLILVLDRQGRVTRLNRAAQRALGFEFEDLLGRNVETIAPWQPWFTIAEVAREALDRGSGVARQARGERSREWQVTSSLVPGQPAGEARVIVLARDVTALVRLEASVRRVESMATLGTLVSGVAHEVRNPLFAISATVDALEARASDRDDLAVFMGTLRGEVARLSRLMRDLLEYGRPPALELEEADVAEVVATAVRSVEPLAAERAIAVRNLVEPRLAVLRLDRVRIAQVVQNLVDNALRLSPPGADVEVRGATVELEGIRRVEIAVDDRGPGFPPADLPRVFDPFFTRRPGGTGLGLAIVRRLVEEHGGSVAALNRAGGGASVRFWLPVTPTPAPGP